MSDNVDVNAKLNNNNINTSTNNVETIISVVKKKKGRPGRPRKNIPKAPYPRHGISNKPTDPSHFMEFLYDKPMIIKKIWTLFKSMAVDKIQWIFKEKNLIMTATDHIGKSRIRICIDCNKVNHYYVQEESDIGILSRDVESILNMIDRTYHTISALSKKGCTQKDIWLINKNESEIDETHKIDVIGQYPKIKNENQFVDEDYQLEFTLDGRYFKKMISDIKSISQTLTIRQDGKDEALSFEYISNTKSVQSIHIARNKKKINLKSNIGEDSTFRVSFYLDYVKPLSSAFLGDKIIVKADENKPLMFIASMDNNTIEIRILTDIINERNPHKF